jgi:hypothetical protein
MGRLDEMAAKATVPAERNEMDASQPDSQSIPAKDVHPARLALQAITIGDLTAFLFKLTIAGIAVAIPFAVVFLIVAEATGMFR